MMLRAVTVAAVCSLVLVARVAGAGEVVASTRGRRLEARLDCVDQVSSRSFVAHFGYRNRSGDAQTVGVGQRNRFGPGRADRGQPTKFEPGAHTDVFRVAFDGSPLIWKLAGGQAIAHAKAKRCAPPACATPCDDGDPCNGTEVCLGGRCAPGVPAGRPAR
jgi:hypothetical protein